MIETSGLNAFATGRRTKDSRIVFTRGLLDTLNKREIEAVAAHELSHIINKDSMLMLVTVVFIGIISVVGELLIRVRIGGNNKGSRTQLIMVIMGIAFLLLGYLIYPLIRLAISRKREFLADAGSVELTKDNQAMISALQKISGQSAVPSANKNIAMFFIESPRASNEEVMGMAKPKASSLRDTHPSIAERISALQHF
jgi:heat shock protein HtpX